MGNIMLENTENDLLALVHSGKRGLESPYFKFGNLTGTNTCRFLVKAGPLGCPKSKLVDNKEIEILIKQEIVLVRQLWQWAQLYVCLNEDFVEDLDFSNRKERDLILMYKRFEDIVINKHKPENQVLHCQVTPELYLYITQL